MRIGILANSLPAAQSIYDEVRSVAGADIFVLLCPAPRKSPAAELTRHLGRLLLKKGAGKSLELLGAGRVIRLRRPLNHADTIARLKQLRLDVGLHKSGNIYRSEMIGCFRLGILNAHIGLLPKYRGRSVMEWSLVQGDPVGISVFFLDEGIDTGRQIVLSESIDVSHCKSIAEAKEYLFSLDAQLYRRAIARLTAEGVQFQENDGSGHRYYVMSKLFLDVAEQNLRALRR